MIRAQLGCDWGLQTQSWGIGPNLSLKFDGDDKRVIKKVECRIEILYPSNVLLIMNNDAHISFAQCNMQGCATKGETRKWAINMRHRLSTKGLEHRLNYWGLELKEWYARQHQQHGLFYTVWVAVRRLCMKSHGTTFDLWVQAGDMCVEQWYAYLCMLYHDIWSGLHSKLELKQNP